jgi:cardiolipin synthase
LRQEGRRGGGIRRTERQESLSRSAAHADAEARAAYPWWLLSLAAVGAAAAGGTAITLFSSVGRRPPRTWATDAPEVGSQDFLLGISGMINAPLSRGGSARLLKNGAEIYPAIFRALREARETINFMVYVWEPGRLSDQVFDALVERARAGVQVRLLLDAIGAARAPEDRIAELEEAGGTVAWFRTFDFGKLTRYYRRNHRRAIVVDGRVGFTGGAAVADYWLGTPGDGRWRDNMVEVHGCLAGNLQSAFAEVWASTCGEILLGPRFFPPHAGDGEGAGEALTYHVNVISSPASDAYPLRLVFWSSFRCARERLYVTSAYFVPDRDLRAVLAERARAGVDVRILVPDEHNDMPPVRLASNAMYRELLQAGVRIYEYQGAMIHAKTFVVDGRWSVIGSANMDVRSRELNLENVLGILDEGFAGQLEQTFLEDLEHAREITLEDWEGRSPWHHVRERFWGIFAEQF